MKNSRLLALALGLMLVASLARAQTYKVLYNFGGNGHAPNDPHYSGIIAQSRGGNLYSTAPDIWTRGPGTAFKITPAGAMTVLHSFRGSDGLHTQSGLTLGTDLYYYGTTPAGGLYSHGTLFKMTDQGVVTTLHHFTGGADGGNPGAPPIEGIDGNFYGTTAIGGRPGNNGTIYRVSRSGAFATIHSFGYASPDGTPNPALTQGKDGYIYGTTVYGGANDLGTIFRFAISGAYATLYSFDRVHGRQPLGALVQADDGNFYGTTSLGGTADAGVIFRITPNRTFTILHNFTAGSDGMNVVGGLLQATDGYFYGTDDIGGQGGFIGGVLFRMSTSGAFSVLHNFSWDSGASPQVTLLQHTNGKIYGDTAVGGVGNNGDGTFFSFDLGLGPFVRFLPDARQVGHDVQLLGQGFVGTSAVSFNGTPAASFRVVADTYMTATVPDRATSGFLTVTTPGGTLKSNKQFLVKPQITGFNPASGPVGATVLISGISLAQTSQVTIGGKLATSFSVNSDKQVTAQVPAGALTGQKITVTTTGAPAYSPATFTVTP
jgi:uncharacterized repeat protein (TIGR03803 family)